MTWRRLLSLLALIAVAVAPFGRMAAAEAAVPSHHMTMTAPGHCDDSPAPDGDNAGKTLDCLTACASLAAVEAAALAILVHPPAAAVALPTAGAAGLVPEAEPPPPRFS